MSTKNLFTVEQIICLSGEDFIIFLFKTASVKRKKKGGIMIRRLHLYDIDLFPRRWGAGE